jgi:hypothetical protein
MEGGGARMRELGTGRGDLLPNEDFKVFKRNLVHITNKYLKSTTAITEVDLNAMPDFSSNFQELDTKPHNP